MLGKRKPFDGLACKLGWEFRCSVFRTYHPWYQRTFQGCSCLRDTHTPVMKPINAVVVSQARLSRTVSLVRHLPVRGKCSHLSACPQEELCNIVPLGWSSSHILVLSGSLSVSLRHGAFGDHHPNQQLVTVSASLWLSSTDGRHNSGEEPGSSEFPIACVPLMPAILCQTT